MAGDHFLDPAYGTGANVCGQKHLGTGGLGE